LQPQRELLERTERSTLERVVRAMREILDDERQAQNQRSEA
jgi:hypothetical protein